MWPRQDAFPQLWSTFGTVLDLLYDRGVAKYWPLESRGSLYVPPRLRSGSASSLLQSKSRRSLWAAIALLVVVSLILFAAFSGKSFTLDRSEQKSATPSELSASSLEHPISQLVRNAEVRFQSCKAAQSSTLQEAIEEYHRRYHMPPPPHFDEWYHFAVRHNTELIDEYDPIHDSLILFWALSPEAIRRRAREALGYDNSLMGVSIRNGVIQVVGSGQDDFQATATKDMISPFAQWLPDMDLAFNVNDEPRILIPHEDVDRMMASAEFAIRSIKPLNDNFTPSNDLNNGQSYDRVSETRFNRLDHQQTWAHSRMSCPPDTPARSLDADIEDAETGFSFGGISFVHNVTMFSDVCLSPSVRQLIGLFNHPNVFAVSHDLVPVFSPSKLSPFHDILYPSPYYYADRTEYDQGFAVKWDDKRPNLYWRGATSGGYSEGGTWKTLLRQSVLSKLLSPGPVRILSRDSDWSDTGPWSTEEIPGSEVVYRYDTLFTEIKQCEISDCTAMRKHFGIHAHAPQEESWKNRYLLDMDGNALSGRFYALLKSLSLPLKVAYYREWHSPRIFPWKHYVPLSASTGEYAEVLRYFEEEEDGMKTARALASQGHEWAEKTIRHVDMQVYMFRLLLEYGRLVDDNRHRVGYTD